MDRFPTYLKLHIPFTTVLNLQEAAVLSMLVSLSNRFKHDCFSATHQWIYECLNISKSTYFRIIGTLKEQGFITHKGKNIGACKTVRTTEFRILDKTKKYIANTPNEETSAETRNKAVQTSNRKQSVPEKQEEISEVQKAQIIKNIQTAPNEAIKEHWIDMANKYNILNVK